MYLDELLLRGRERGREREEGKKKEIWRESI